MIDISTGIKITYFIFKVLYIWIDKITDIYYLCTQNFAHYIIK